MSRWWSDNTDLFDPDTIWRMIGHYQRLLEGIVSNPQQRLSELPILTDRERHQILVEWNRTQVNYRKDRCLHQLVEKQVERTPDAVAVAFQGSLLTYRELNQRANQLARHLQKLGVGPETLVGICVERSLEMVIGILGILKAGGAYVPLDPAYPSGRLTFMIKDARMQVLLTEARFLQSLPERPAPVVCLDRDWNRIKRESGENLSAVCALENLAYVIYTSGSTGKPKGVAIEHRSAVAFASWARTVFTEEEFAGVLFSTSICSDLSVFELFATLACGGKVILSRTSSNLRTCPAPAK